MPEQSASRAESSPRSRMQPSPPEGGSFDPQRLWQLIRRRRFYLFLPILVMGVVVGGGLQTITPVYTSTSSVHIEERSTGSSIDRIMLTPQMQRVRDRNRLTVVREKIRSVELLLKVIRNLRLREEPGVIAEATQLQSEKLPDQTVSIIAERILVNRLRNKIWVRNYGSDIFVVSVEDNDPTTAYKLNEAITQAFIDQVTRERYETLLDTRSFTDEQLETARADLETAEQELGEFKRSMLVDEELSGNPVTKDNSRRAENLLRLARLDRDESQRELAALREELRAAGIGPNPLSAILEDPEVVSLKERLSTLEREDHLGQLQASGGAGGGGSRSALSPERQRIGVQRNRLSERIQSLTERWYAEEPPELRARLALLHELEVVGEVLTRHEEQIAREYRIFLSRVQEQPAQEAELRRLEGNVERAETFLQTLVAAELAGETTLSAEQSGFGTRIRMLEPPKKPLFPSRPNKVRIGLMAAVLAFGIGMGAIFLSEYVDTSFKDVQEVVQRTGLEVLGTLPRFAGEFHWEKRKRRRSLMWRTAFALALVAVMTLFLLYYRRSTVQDQVLLVGEPRPPVTQSGGASS